MDDPFLPRDSSSPPVTHQHQMSNLNNFILPPIRPTRPRPVIDLGHIETLRDVENAFRHADVALRQAREALRNDAIMSGRYAGTTPTGDNNGNSRNGNSNGGTNDVVDLTTISSESSNEDPEVQWSATRHPNDSQPRGRTLRDIRHGPAPRAVPSGSGFSVAGTLAPIRTYPPYINLPGVSNHRAEESAIRRQRQARRDWERVERRNRERAAEIAQRDAVEQARRQADQVPRDGGVDGTNTNDTRARRYSSDSSTSSISFLSNDSLNSEDTNPTTHQNTQNTSNPSDSSTITTMPSTQSIDLTRFEDPSNNLKDKILSQQQQSAIAAQKSPVNPSSKDPTSAKPHATPLSTYRCAICMDTPTTATTTICGHVFCHTCLKDSLKWSAQQRRDDAGLHGRRAPNAGTGLCPVCRKVLPDKEGGSKPGIVGLEIRTVSRKEWERRKKQEKVDEERDNFLRSLGEKNAEVDSKGKEKEKEPTDYVKMEDQSDSQSFERFQPPTGRFTRKRRRDEMGEHAEYHNLEGF